MRLTKITYQNLKGRTEEVALGAATFIHGDNFTGKTTIVDAIKLALLGHHPSLDKTARGIFELCSGDELIVTAEFDDGRQIGRVWRRSGDRITGKEFVPVGWPPLPVALLDANAYFGASDRGKAELLFRASRFSEAGERAEIVKALDEFGVAIKAVAGTETVQEFVSRALNEVEMMRSAEAASVKRYADTLQGLSALRDAAPVPLDEDVGEKLARKRANLQAADRDLAKAERDQADHRRAETPDDLEVAALELESRELNYQISNKAAETQKAAARWAALLNHTDCPMCGTEGAKWKPAAKRKQKAELATLDGEKIKLTQKRFETNRSIDELKAKIKPAREKQAEADVVEVLKHEEICAGLREEIGALERDMDAYVRDQADRRRLAEARDAHSRHSAREKLRKDAKAYLLGAKARMAERLFDPILEAARLFTDGVLRAPLAFNDGELGYWRNFTDAGNPIPRSWVPHRTFSGTEQAIAFAAFQAALGATAPIKLVVMDELGRLDAENKARLLINVAVALRDSRIDQFIGIDTDAEVIGDNAIGWTLIERTRELAASAGLVVGSAL